MHGPESTVGRSIRPVLIGRDCSPSLEEVFSSYEHDSIDAMYQAGQGLGSMNAGHNFVV